MDIYGKSVDMAVDVDRKFHIHGKPDYTGGGSQKSNP